MPSQCARRDRVLDVQRARPVRGVYGCLSLLRDTFGIVVDTELIVVVEFRPGVVDSEVSSSERLREILLQY